jgi:hypothetical protein
MCGLDLQVRECRTWTFRKVSNFDNSLGGRTVQEHMHAMSSPVHADSALHRCIKSVGWLRWLFVTKEGNVVIAQIPNAPLIIAVIADVVAYFSTGQVRMVSMWIAQVLFVIWAVMEIGWGVNPFRRILGAVVLALVGFAMYHQLS